MKNTLGTISLVFYVVIAFSIMSSIVFFSSTVQNMIDTEIVLNPEGTIVICNYGSDVVDISDCTVEYVGNDDCDIYLGPHVDNILRSDDCFSIIFPDKCLSHEGKVRLNC